MLQHNVHTHIHNIILYTNMLILKEYDAYVSCTIGGNLSIDDLRSSNSGPLNEIMLGV